MSHREERQGRNELHGYDGSEVETRSDCGKRLRRVLPALLPILLSALWVAHAAAQGAGGSITPAAPSSAYASVEVDGRKLFDVLGAGGFSAADRADRINRRLQNLV